MFLAESSWRKRPSNSSAGGQLEHPSEVNSSTTTALRGTPGSVVLATTMETQIAAATRIATAKVRPMLIGCLPFRAAVSHVGSWMWIKTGNRFHPLSKPVILRSVGPKDLLLEYLTGCVLKIKAD